MNTFDVCHVVPSMLYSNAVLLLEASITNVPLLSPQSVGAVVITSEITGNSGASNITPGHIVIQEPSSFVTITM